MSAFEFTGNVYGKNEIRQLISICSNQASLELAEGRILNFIENLSTFIQVVSTKDLSSQSVVPILIDTLLNSNSNEIYARFLKVLPKIVRICLNLSESDKIKSYENVTYSLNVLLCLVCNLKRNMVQLNAISELCKSLLCQHQYIELAGDILANSFSNENASQWNEYWDMVASDLARVVSHFNFITVTNDEFIKFQSGEENASFIGNKRFDELIRIHNIQMVGSIESLEALACGLTRTLVQMLNCGCSSEPISLNLSVLLPLIGSVLATTIQCNKRQSSLHTRNKNGFTMEELATILPTFKIQSLILLNAILQSQNASLLRFSGYVVDPILSFLANPHVHDIFESNPSIRLKTLENFLLIIKMFPSVVGRPSSVNSLNVVIDMFQRTIRYLVQSEVTVTLSTSSSNNSKNRKNNSYSASIGITDKRKASLSSEHSHDVHHGTDSSSNSSNSSYQDIALIFQVVEYLLLFCGSTLSPVIRQRVETSVTQALWCLTKGIMPYAASSAVSPSAGDSKTMRRSQCEKLRASLPIINLVIKLAGTEVLIPNTDGVMSGNVTLLKQVCNTCLVYPATCYEAAKALAVLDAMIFPTMVTLPTNHSILTRRTLVMSGDRSALFADGTSAYADTGENTVAVATRSCMVSETNIMDVSNMMLPPPELQAATVVVTAIANKNTTGTTTTTTAASSADSSKVAKPKEVSVPVHFFHTKQQNQQPEQQAVGGGGSSSSSSIELKPSSIRQQQQQQQDDDEFDIPDIVIDGSPDE